MSLKRIKKASLFLHKYSCNPDIQLREDCSWNKGLKNRFIATPNKPTKAKLVLLDVR